MTKTNYILLLLLVTISLGAKGKTNRPTDIFGGKITVHGTKFIDSHGRQVIFSGMNYVNKDPKTNYITKDSSAVYEQMGKWGINCLRLGLIWDGAEPQPGKYDEKYLDQIEQKVKWAAQHSIYVMLDMHQDLYSRKYADGAPEWATLDENMPHQTGQIWSDAYLISPAVQKSFDNFWANKPVSDGVGVQDHYINMWRQIAKRFSKYDNVIGYDIMNEPFNGSEANAIMPLILKEYAALQVEESGQTPPTEDELMMIWANEKSRLEVLKKLTAAPKYARIIDAAYEANKKFETTKLQAMYQKATDAIRLVDTNHIVFLEHPYFGNPGIHSALSPVKDKDGKPDRNQAYAAHGYDLLVDSEESDNPNNERVDLIFSRINETSKRMNIPVLVGEWGAFYGSENKNSINAARNTIGLFERFHFGNTYWSYSDGLTKLSYFKEALVRPYPQFVAGSLTSYSVNYDTGIFTCTWKEENSVTEPTVIYIPDLNCLTKESIKLSPGKTHPVIKPIDNSNAGYLIIQVDKNATDRSLNFKIKRTPIEKR
jgi:endoglycosylceramidase